MLKSPPEKPRKLRGPHNPNWQSDILKRNIEQRELHPDMEKWVPMINHPEYEISNLGFIRSIATQCYLSVNANGASYPYVVFQKSSKLKRKRKAYVFHRLLAIHFIPNPENKSEVNHINAIKTDYSLSNLEWVTSKENSQHALKLGLLKVPCLKEENHPMAKLKERDVINILKMYYVINMPTINIAKAFDMHMDMITLITCGRHWKDTFKRFKDVYGFLISPHHKKQRRTS